MRRIKVIIPNAGMSRQVLDERERMLSSVLDKDSILSVDCIDKGPKSIQSRYDEILAGEEVLKKIILAEKSCFDAVVIYCFSDLGLEAAREVVSIPVIGPGETSVSLAGMIRKNFSVITMLKSSISRTEERIKNTDICRCRMISVRSVDIPVPDLRENPEFTRQKLLEVCSKAVYDDGAGAVILGCLGMAGFGDTIKKQLNIPIIDPAFVSVCAAELRAKLQEKAFI